MPSSPKGYKQLAAGFMANIAPEVCDVSHEHKEVEMMNISKESPANLDKEENTIEIVTNTVMF